jgi:hypothetical protein
MIPMKSTVAANTLVSLFEQVFDGVARNSDNHWIVGDDVAATLGVTFSDLRPIIQRDSVKKRLDRAGYAASVKGNYVVVERTQSVGKEDEL